MWLWGKITAFMTLMNQFHVECLSVSQERAFLHRRPQSWTLPVGRSWAIRWLQHFAAIPVLQINQTQKLLCKDLGFCGSGKGETNSFISVHEVLCSKICNIFPYQDMMNKAYMDVVGRMGRIVCNAVAVYPASVWMELGVSSCVATMVSLYQCLCFSQKTKITKKSWQAIHSGQIQTTFFSSSSLLAQLQKHNFHYSHSPDGHP